MQKIPNLPVVDQIAQQEKRGKDFVARLIAQLHDTTWFSRLDQGKVINLIRQLLAEIQCVKSYHCLNTLGIIASALEEGLIKQILEPTSTIKIEQLNLAELPEVEYGKFELIESQLPEFYIAIQEQDSLLKKQAADRSGHNTNKY